MPPDYFFQAYDRARQIAARSFDGSDRITVVLSASITRRNHQAALLRIAQTCGIELPGDREHAVVVPVDPGDPARSLVAFEADKDLLSRLLWGALAAELGIRPHLECAVYLADPSRGVLLHPYDDRGMDAIGPNTALLQALYQEFHDWLLEHDLPRMRALFSVDGASPGNGRAGGEPAEHSSPG